MILFDQHGGRRNIDELVWVVPLGIVDVVEISDWEEPDWSEYSEYMRPIGGEWC